MKRITLVIALWAVFVATGSAQKNNTEQQLIKDANELFDRGEFLKAFPLYSQLVSLYPQDPTYNFKFGTCAIYGQPDKTQAIKHLSFATKKNVEDPMAWYYLGKALHLNYQFKDALEAYKGFNQKVDPKLAEKFNTSREIEMCSYGTGLLANMKDVVVLNKVESDRENFFRYFNVEDVGGKILTVPFELRSKLDEKTNEPGVMFYPNNSTTIFFSSYGKDGSTGKDIYRANVLPDGKFSTPEKLTGGVNTKYDEDFCFMHSNGKTFYFASKGHNSMGGYDIFKCNYDAATNSFGDAINLDFAINTPDDDILFITDKNNEKAYFASGRSSDQDHLHVYNVMVQGIPTQIIYLKGDFISEINPDQKNARIVVKDAMTDRPIQEINTDGSSGSYVLYVPNAGEYKFLVSTENSPLVHEGSVKIPQYGQPVAFRQEMRLVKENGVEKLVINNFFDTPLTDDLASLAADMLRSKAGLEVNANEQILREIEDEDPADDIIVEKTMSNAPLAAGFAEGVTVPQLIKDISNEASRSEVIAKEFDKKSELAMAYALKKQTEADAMLKKAEGLRNQTSTYLAADDVSRLRESYAMSKEAEELRMEATCAISASEAANQKAMEEREKSISLREKGTALESSFNSNNFDETLANLKVEKERQTSLKGISGNEDLEAMQAKARAKNSEKLAAEEKLNQLRQDEKKLTSDLAAAEQKMNSARKKSDKATSETEYANLKSGLDAKKREILNADIRAEQLNDEATALFGEAEFYMRLRDDNTGLGLTAAEKRSLSDAEVTALNMKLNEMDDRLKSLEIKDPQMLAIIGDEKTGPALASNVVEIRSSTESVVARLPKEDPASTGLQRMVYDHTLGQVNNEIYSLESNQASLKPEEKTRLEELKNYRTDLVARLNEQPEPVAATDEMRLAFNEATPGYDTRLQEINNASGTEVDRAQKAIGLREETMNDLVSLKAENAEKAKSTTNPSELQALAEKDRQYTASINALRKETDGVSPYQLAYESGNKSIIESDDDFSSKLTQQIVLGESYDKALASLEVETKAELDSNPQPARRVQLENTLNEIKNNRQEMTAKVSGYKSDLELTMSTSQPKSFDTTAVAATTSVATVTLEDELEKQGDTDENGEHGDDEPAKSKEEQDASVMKELFTRRVEEESIIAYETGALDEIVAKHQCDTMTVNNRDKIAEIQDEIFLVEAEMENESSTGKQKKLDRSAEKLYLKRALLEISNAEAISKMTKAEYTNRLATVEKMNKQNKEKIDSRVMIRDEVRTLFNKAKDEMEDASVLRKKAGPVIDDIEKNDFYRRAFAKEMYAIRLLQQVEDIHGNLDMMLTYNDQELTALRYGKPLPKPAGDAPLASADLKAGSETKTDVPASTVTPKSTTAANTNATAGNTTAPSGTPIKPAGAGVIAPNRNASASSVQLMTAQPLTSGNKSATEVATEVLGVEATDAEKTALMQSTPFVDYMANLAVASGNDASRLALINERNNILTDVRAIEAEIAKLEKARDAATTQAEKDRIQAEINTLAQRRDDKYADIALLDQQIAAMNKKVENMNTQGQTLMADMTSGAANRTVNVPVKSTSGSESTVSSGNSDSGSNYTPAGSTSNYAPATSSSNYAPAAASSSSGAGAGADAMYFNFPSALTSDLFTMKSSSVYSESRPIPVDVMMPSGVYYKVQVGAFRNRIPQDLFDDFAPVSGETISNGVVRYTAGFFLNYKNADAVKKMIRQIGYSDAFIVAYRDGKRIPLFEAIDKTDGAQFAALIESEYVHGDSAPKKVADAATSGFAPGSGDYYNKYPNAVKAVQVETVSGLFYTVQVGVYSRAVSASDLHYVAPLCTELTANKKIRYTSGMFTDLNSAVGKRAEARNSGISDAFVTAYYNGKRISLTEADRLIKENGPSILATPRQ